MINLQKESLEKFRHGLHSEYFILPNTLSSILRKVLVLLRIQSEYGHPFTQPIKPQAQNSIAGFPFSAIHHTEKVGLNENYNF
jgi:hypothetical protein